MQSNKHVVNIICFNQVDKLRKVARERTVQLKRLYFFWIAERIQYAQETGLYLSYCTEIIRYVLSFYCTEPFRNSVFVCTITLLLNLQPMSKDKKFFVAFNSFQKELLVYVIVAVLQPVTSLPIICFQRGIISLSDGHILFWNTVQRYVRAWRLLLCVGG